VRRGRLLRQRKHVAVIGQGKNGRVIAGRRGRVVTVVDGRVQNTGWFLRTSDICRVRPVLLGTVVNTRGGPTFTSGTQTMVSGSAASFGVWMLFVHVMLVDVVVRRDEVAVDHEAEEQRCRKTRVGAVDFDGKRNESRMRG